MPRDIPVGNGSLLICFDQYYNIRDLYFPHVGQENHVQGEYCRLGIWVDNRFSWVDESWKIDLGYEEDTLITRVNLYHEGLGMLLVCRDMVDFHENIYLREIVVENMLPQERQVRIFCSQNLDISGNSVGDTAALDPESGGLVHYKGSRYFLIGAKTAENSGPDQFAVGQKNINGKEGTYIDAEDGLLSGNTIAQGSVDSVLGLHLNIKGLSREKAYYWIVAGENWHDVRLLDSRIKYKSPETLIKRTGDYWHLWVHKEALSLDMLPPAVAKLYRRSLLVLNTQIDAQGGILAANDSWMSQAIRKFPGAFMNLPYALLEMTDIFSTNTILTEPWHHPGIPGRRTVSTSCPSRKMKPLLSFGLYGITLLFTVTSSLLSRYTGR